MLTRLYRQAWLWSAYWRLYPLWAMLRQTVPEVELPLEPAMRWDIRYRLHRRVIEIRDAQLMPRPYSTPQVAAYAASAARSSGLDPGTVATVVEAAVIVESLQRRLQGSPPGNEKFPAVQARAVPANDVRAEAARLIMVGRAVRRSRLVRRIAGLPPDRIMLLGSPDEGQAGGQGLSAGRRAAP